MFVLVRHGHAGDKRAFPQDDRLRPLSQAGWQQAQGLAENLISLIQPSALLASPYLRGVQTLEPLARRCGHVIHSSDLLAPGASPVALAQHLAGVGGDPIVYCTHGESLKGLLSIWADQDVRLLADGFPATSARTEKGGAWLVLTDPVFVAHYIRPLHVGPVLIDIDLTRPEAPRLADRDPRASVSAGCR